MARVLGFLFYALVFRFLAVLARTPDRDGWMPITTASEEALEHFERGRTAAFHYSFEMAVKHLDRAIAADPNFPLVYIYRGGSTNNAKRGKRKGYFDQAFALKDRASEGERRMIEAFSAFLLDGDHERAADIFRELTSEYPDDPFVPAHLALRYVHALDRYNDAVEYFKLALQRDPEFVPVYNWLGYALLKADRPEEADRVFQDSLERHADDPFTHNFIGEVFLTVDRNDAAERLFKRALELDPTFKSPRVNLIRVGIEAGKRRLEQALLREDSAVAAEVLTEDAQLLSLGEEVLQGRAAIQELWADAFATEFTQADLEAVEVFAGTEGGSATEVGRYHLGRDEGTDHVGRYVAVWQRTGNGWKLHRVMWARLQG